MEKSEEKPQKAPTKAELEREKLTVENIKLRREITKNLWWYLSKLQVIIQVIIPVVTLIVTTVVLYNQIQTQKQIQAIEQQRFESELTRQFASTVKDLESEWRSIRLGAVLSMENFIPLSEQYRGQVYLLLCDLLKEEAQKIPRDSTLFYHICESFRKLSSVKLAEEDSPISLYLVNTKLDSLPLYRFDLRKANLERADLRATDLQGANLERANLYRANLWGANLFRANLSGTNLRRAYLRLANLLEANLRGANLRHADLTGAHLWGANLERADLYRANLLSANLGEANLRGADLRQADLRQVNLERANLWEADLRKAMHLTLVKLSKVKTLYETKLDSSFLEQVKENYPHLLEKPTEKE